MNTLWMMWLLVNIDTNRIIKEFPTWKACEIHREKEHKDNKKILCLMKDLN